LHTLLHAISADAQAHKRYWQAAPLTPVHGSPDPDNLRLAGGQVALVDWECFGMGDPALEVATWAGLMSFEGGGEAEKSFTGSYLEGNEDELLPTRIEIYKRIWPFGYLLPLLAQAVAASAGARRPLPERKVAILVHCFVRLMLAYERPASDVEQVEADLRKWLGLTRGVSPAQS
jgi:aminoglycoside phosphotransferase (APT) family kinase protein